MKLGNKVSAVGWREIKKCGKKGMVEGVGEIMVELFSTTEREDSLYVAENLAIKRVVRNRSSGSFCFRFAAGIYQFSSKALYGKS